MREDARFLEVSGEQVYLFRHRPTGTPRARVVMAGAFGLERTYTYATLVRVARALCASGCEVVRFDPRGLGESSGDVNGYGPADWAADLDAVLDEVKGDGLFTILFGLRFGGLLASSVFSAGRGDALLLWSPVTSAQAFFMDTLRRKLAEDFSEGAAGSRDRDALVVELEDKGVLEVDGYRWGRALLGQAEGFELAVDENEARPWRWIELAPRVPRRAPASHVVHAPGPRPPIWSLDVYLAPPIEAAMAATTAFVDEALGARREAGGDA